MNVILRKAKLSFIAMFFGWMACNLTAWIVGAFYAVFATDSVESVAWTIGIFAMGSGIVISGVWLVIFFPVDLIVADTSFLRRPAVAFIAGLTSAFTFTLIHLGVVLTLNSGFELTQVLLPELLFTGVTGSVAAWARCLLEPCKLPNRP